MLNPAGQRLEIFRYVLFAGILLGGGIVVGTGWFKLNTKETGRKEHTGATQREIPGTPPVRREKLRLLGLVVFIGILAVMAWLTRW